MRSNRPVVMQAVVRSYRLTEPAPLPRGLVLGVTIAVAASILLLAGLTLAIRLASPAGPPIKSQEPAITSTAELAPQ